MNKEILKYPLIVVLAVFVFGFSLLDIVTPDRKFSSLENRILEQKPTLTVENLLNNEFTPKYEEYINDQFFGRDLWIDIKSRAEFALGKIENNGIVYGKDHYMFEKYKNVNEVRLNKNVGFIKKFIEDCDYPVTFGIIPSSYMKNADKLPYGLMNVNQYEYMDHIYSELAKTKNRQGRQTGILNLEKTPLKYYRTDHHWTTKGAYEAYAELMKQMGLPVVKKKELAPIEKRVHGFYGSYFNKSKAFDAIPDDMVYYDIPVKSMTINGKPVKGLYDMSKLKTRDKYSMFLHSNNSITEIESDKLLTGVKKDSRVLLIKDSFGNSLAPFLTYDFGQVSVVDLRSMGSKLSAYLEKNKFDQVIILYSFMNLSQDANIVKITH